MKYFKFMRKFEVMGVLTFMAQYNGKKEEIIYYSV